MVKRAWLESVGTQHTSISSSCSIQYEATSKADIWTTVNVSIDPPINLFACIVGGSTDSCNSRNSVPLSQVFKGPSSTRSPPPASPIADHRHASPLPTTQETYSPH